MFRRHASDGLVHFTVNDVCVSHTQAPKYNIPPWLCSLALSDVPDPPPHQAPASYLGSLHSYQKKALGFALHRPRTMLALDCGLGKTHVGMAYMLLHLPAMVVCPASLKASWEEHILSYAPSAMKDITIVSYNKMERIPGVQCIVADEAHYLKHESSQRSKTFTRLLAQCRRTLLLTGTPAQRNVDLFHILKLLDPIHFRHFYHYGHKKVPGKLYFAERYSTPKPVWIGGARHGFKFTANQNSEELALVCAHFILRMKKDAVATLPTLHTQAVTVGTVHNPAYYTRRRTEIDEVRQVKGNRRADVEMLSLCRETSQQKMPFVTPYIASWLQTHPYEKVIVFYHHQAIGDQLVHALGTVGHIRIDGKTSMKKRVQQIQTFRTDPACRVGVLSMCATSTGLNLQFCTKIIFAELTFLSVHHTQAESRIHRIGQDREVSVDYLLLDGTTDPFLWRSLVAKRKTETILFDSDCSAPVVNTTNAGDSSIEPL
jgi:SWI/SNF-related matrix-associated actin-dependent regulator 1 of chromatin subfamily A